MGWDCSMYLRLWLPFMHTGQDLHSPTRDQWGGSAVAWYLQEVQKPNWLRAKLFCHHLPNGVSYRETQKNTSYIYKWWMNPLDGISKGFKSCRCCLQKGNTITARDRQGTILLSPGLKCWEPASCVPCIIYPFNFFAFPHQNQRKQWALSQPLHAPPVKSSPSTLLSNSHCRVLNTSQLKPLWLFPFYK